MLLLYAWRNEWKLRMDFGNSTQLDGARLHEMFERHTHPYRHDQLRVRVRYSRGAPFSGTCYYTEGRIFVNIGRDNDYPFRIATHIARAESSDTHWWCQAFRLIVPDPHLLALFVYLHELYHYLVKQAKRNPRRKEGMCDRFATRVLVDEYGCALVDARGRNPVARHRWDFQDLDAFISAAPKVPMPEKVARRDIPVTIHGGRAATRPRKEPVPGTQLNLFADFELD